MSTDINVPIKQKRGRKSKKELQAIQEQKNLESLNNINSENSLLDTNNNLNQEIDFSFEEKNNDENNIDIDSKINLLDTNEENTIVKPPPKKRGRKPKGGKIIQQTTPLTNVKEEKANVILHLKCSLKDLQEQTHNNFNMFNITNEQLEPYNSSVNYQVINLEEENISNIKSSNYHESTTNINNLVNLNKNYYDSDSECYNNNDVQQQTKEVWKKLKQLEHNLHTNNISDKKSACFWCTYDFDNPPVYIPKYNIKDTYHVYGCFCSPECATAYLMEENIDSSTRFERYHLINHIYSKIYDYNKNIKPAPNPYYMLNKFYGNLSIQEYRSLLKNERLFLIVDKPLTRILPELHEDNDDFIINNKIIPSNNYQIKKKLQKKIQTKTNILNEKFGLNA